MEAFQGGGQRGGVSIVDDTYVSTAVAEGKVGALGKHDEGLLLNGEESREYIKAKGCEGAGNRYNEHRLLSI